MGDKHGAGDEHANDVTDGAEALEGLEAAAETNGAGTNVAPERMARPRAARRAAAREIGNFGAIPVECTAWGIKRETRSGSWEELCYGEDEVQLHVWPLSDLSDATIVARWGHGTFRTQWFKPGPGGGRKFICQGSLVTYRERPREAPAAPAGRDSVLSDHLEFMRLVGAEAESKIQATLALAKALRGDGDRPQQAAGITGSDLLAVLREERAAQAAATQAALEAQAAATSAAIAAAVAPLQAAIEELTPDEDDAADTAAKAIAAMTKKKGGFIGALAWAAENKDLIREGAPVVLGAINALAEMAKASQRASQAAIVVESRPVARPRASATVVDAEPASTATPEQEDAWSRLPVDAPPPKPPAAPGSPSAEA